MDPEMASPQKLRELAESARAFGVRAEYSVRQGQVADEIVSLAKERNADFIVMSVHVGDLADGTRLHGTVSDVVREANCPVLTVPQHRHS